MHPTGLLVQRYWGPRLPRREDYPGDRVSDKLVMGSYVLEHIPFNSLASLLQEEYPAYGGTKYFEPCLKATFADGVRDVVLQFDRAEILDTTIPEVQITLRDAHYPLEVTLHYRVWEAYDLIERFVTLRNTGSDTIQVDRVWSAQWHVPPGGPYHLSHLHGRWANEFQLRHEELTEGVKVLESRRITSSHHHSPWFAVDRGQTSEDHGPLWYGSLAWSGNWKIAAEVTSFATTRLNIGLNDWDFAWQLEPETTFTTPSSYGGFTNQGYGTASRRLHDFIRERVLSDGQSLRKVLYNSWETTYFDVDEESQAHFAEIAADMGIELFVMDDGWFHGRKTDHAGLGDWWPDAEKFPKGLGGLIRRVNDLGMDFGLWIEPEMVNPDSELYRSHPDWAIHFPTRARTESRNQLILNLAKPEVQDYLIEHLDRLLAENNITFIKWDMNRNVSEPGWSDAPRDARELWVRYVEGVYRVWDTLRQRHPGVVWQSCSGGGGRADIAILERANQVWVSDNTIPVDRLSIQAGYSHVFPANTMEAWVTDMGDDWLPLSFRFHVSMCGVLGVGADLRKWGEVEMEEARKWIALYKQIRPVIQNGDLYRLGSPFDDAFFGVQYVSKDQSESVLFAFHIHPTDLTLPRVLHPQGLDPQRLYRIEDADVPERSGAGWANIGVEFAMGVPDSKIVVLRSL